jgi:SAM-dependent methyltransferase
MKHHYLREKCRLCDSKNLINVLPLAPTPLCDAYLKSPREQELYPLDLIQCNDCGFVQIECVVDPEIIYRDYIYVTTSSSGLSNHFQSYSAKVLEFLGLKPNSFVMDIGSNDGTLLGHFKARGNRVLGVEPSRKTAQNATERGIETLPEFFGPQVGKAIKEKYGSPDLITINNLFANIDDLQSFTSALEAILAPDGVLVIESSYLADMVDNMVFDFIYHEHLSYFSILPLVNFFAKFNMRLINVERVDTKGGSLRYYWAKNTSQHEVNASVDVWINAEKDKKIDGNYFAKYRERINQEKTHLIAELDRHRGTKIIGYGASATSTTLIYHFGLNKYLDLLIDDNPAKVDTFSPGCHIPVKRLADADLPSAGALVILAWRYKNEIIPKLKNFAGAIVTPLPQIEIQN